jgi:hypothetical protein
MENDIHRAINGKWLDNILFNQGECWVVDDIGDVVWAAGDEVIEDSNFIAFGQKPLRQM